MKDPNKTYLKKAKNNFFEKWSILGYTDTLIEQQQWTFGALNFSTRDYIATECFLDNYFY